MALVEQEISTAQLEVGMYVSRLDRDWTGTPFPLQGLLVSGIEDIDQLRQYASRVWIDVEKSSRDSRERLRQIGAQARNADAGLIKRFFSLSSLEDELPRARRMLDDVSDRAMQLLGKLSQGGHASQAEISEVVEPVVQSLERNPDAYFWLEALRSRHHYTYSHAMNCCALAAAFARHRGLPEDDVRSMATGGLLIDIGMGAVPPEIIHQAGELDELGRKFVERHVKEGADRLQQSGIRDPLVLEMLLNHHERHSGGGYPRRIAGDDITVAGQIAGLIDAFDAMTSDRPWRKAMGRAEALHQLSRERDALFSQELVEDFVRCVGVYPVGTLVELNTGEVGIVMTRNPEHRLRPRVMMLTNPAKQLRAHYIPIDLADTSANPALERVHIARGLVPGSHGIDPAALQL